MPIIHYTYIHIQKRILVTSNDLDSPIHYTYIHIQKRILVTSNDLDSPNLKDALKQLISSTKSFDTAKMAYIPTAAMNMYDSGT